MPIPSLSLRPKSKFSASQPSNRQLVSEQSALPPNSDASSVGTLPKPDARPFASATQPSTAQQDSVGATKRRSFLPQRGGVASKTLAGKSGPADKQPGRSDGTHITRDLRTSDHTPSSTDIEQREQTCTAPPTRTMRPPDALNKPSESQPALGRTQSLRKPGTATQTASSSSAASRAHTRTQSTNAIAGPPKGAAEPRSHMARPRSLLIAPSPSIMPTSQSSANVLPGTHRSFARIDALKRSASTRVRSEGKLVTEATGTVTGAQNGAVQSGRRREVVKEDTKKPSRPAFSTLQQHFTPRKTGKAPTSVFLHPPAPDAGTLSLSPELLSLQAELLQLHILHANSAQVSRDWDLSAKQTLHVKFDEVVSLYHVMHEIEREGQEQKNFRALREWNSGAKSFGLVEQIQVLSGPLHELPSIVDSGGRFERVVDEFSRWIVSVEDIWATRKNNAKTSNGDLRSTEGLDDSWRAENAALTRKLTTFARDLDRLTQPDSDSSISKIVATCRGLLSGVLEELQIMQRVEAAVVDREKEWVESRLQSMAAIGLCMDSDEGREAWRA